MNESRFGGDEEGFPIGLWLGMRKRALRGQRGLHGLADLKKALEYMPTRELASGVLCDAQGRTCAVGELAVYRKMAQGYCRKCAVREIHADPLNDGGTGAWDTVWFARDRLQVAESWGWAVSWENDEGYFDFKGATDAGRWQHVYDWVCAEIAAAEEQPLSYRVKRPGDEGLPG